MTPAVASLVRDLEQIAPGRVTTDMSLAAISRWQVGGTADLIVHPGSESELSQIRSLFFRNDLPHIVIGATSNLMFADEGLRAPCIQIGSDLASVQVKGDHIRAGAGLWVPGLARIAMLHSLGGIAHVCGIPGTLGGLVCMNGGSQRKGIGSHISRVSSVTTDGSRIARRAKDCGFAYRTSIFQSNDEAVSSVELILDAGHDPNALRHEMRQIMRSRRLKFPQKLPNCGSVFVSNPAMYAKYGPPGAVIESLGFKGRQIGGAMVSPLHANFIVNTGSASASDILSLIRIIRDTALQQTGYLMDVEARFVHPNGRIEPAGSVTDAKGLMVL
ncbi:UDP-N-acetylmuramate dehydrogenase [Qingshengfaniella alkalisoli]|uniref:UDP-N-acetylenolpyruvoylglucosamine reductase n=1 Tax=Qingshengfaniella alkalisoli TaxID=2599296 RepID=A0A5B8I9A0_9RHOB|nr:UDP-N-acetylmuramate dehydrogenase [Qingshengfaniella alkalisoli]QDY70805.1 UDP-N-acetylmuramate dehydrogenase [Qingshengfaniella alkalisoli]